MTTHSPQCQLAFNQHPDELLSIPLTARLSNELNEAHNILFEFKQICWDSKNILNNSILISNTNQPPYVVVYDSIRIAHNSMTNDEQIALYGRLTENDIIL